MTGLIALLLYLAAMAYAVQQARPVSFRHRIPWVGAARPSSASMTAGGSLGQRFGLRTPEGRPVKAARSPFAVPAWFRVQALCVHSHESPDWHIQNPPYSGGLQFTTGTWYSAGGTGRAGDHSPAEQIYRAYRIWRNAGGSWRRDWPNTSRMCGLS